MELYTPVLALPDPRGRFAIFSVVMSALTGPKRYNRAKLDSYECGIEPTPQPVGGGRFPVRYYITAMMFIVFDIEIVFLYPIAVAFDQMALFGLIEMVLFIVPVFVAYVYVWRRGGLDWDCDARTLPSMRQSTAARLRGRLPLRLALHAPRDSRLEH